MDCDRVLPNLFVGCFPEDAAEMRDLRALGITAILSVQSEDDLDDGLDGQEAAARSAELVWRNVAVRDFDVVDLRRKLPQCVMALDGLLAAGHTVYLHCTAGVGRSPTVAAAYLHWYQAWPLEQALRHLRSCRDCSPRGAAIRDAVWPVEGGTPSGKN